MKFIKELFGNGKAGNSKHRWRHQQNGGGRVSNAAVSGFFLFYSSKPTWLWFNCDAEVIRELLRVAEEY